MCLTNAGRDFILVPTFGSSSEHDVLGKREYEVNTTQASFTVDKFTRSSFACCRQTRIQGWPGRRGRYLPFWRTGLRSQDHSERQVRPCWMTIDPQHVVASLWLGVVLRAARSPTTSEGIISV
uniref:Uncharacterized protein n=1 Tax=Schistocephalus solidus TaxID=70667 RepID=A0A0X3P6M9_SCHSO